MFEPPGLSESFFAGIHRLPPGHLLKVTLGGLECRQYWHPANARPTKYKKDEDYAEALLEVFDRATEARLRSTKSVGSFLSAGLDSSSVTAAAARILAATGKSLTAFTAVPRPNFSNLGEPWGLIDEGPGASEVAGLYPNLHHALVDSTGYDVLPTLKSWTDALGEPVLNAVNCMWLTAIFDRARQQGINVLLEGTGGNLSISWQTLQILPHLFHRGRWIKLLKTAQSLRGHGDISIRSAVRITLGGLLPAWISHRLIHPSRLQSLYSPVAHPDLMSRHAVAARLFAGNFGSLGVVAERMHNWELSDGGPYNAAAQAVSGIETRDPCADKRVYEFCFSIPPEQYIVGGHSRSLVRRAMKGRLPESTLNRYTRGNQGADWYLPMREALPSLLDEVSLQQQSPAARQTLDLPRMQSLLVTFPASGFETNAVSLTWNHALTRGISMGYFLRSNESAHIASATPAIDSAVRPSAEATPPVAAPAG
jgi:asparagine synthase (glutamine-hydrolysing)